MYSQSEKQAAFFSFTYTVETQFIKMEDCISYIFVCVCVCAHICMKKHIRTYKCIYLHTGIFMGKILGGMTLGCLPWWSTDTQITDNFESLMKAMNPLTRKMYVSSPHTLHMVSGVYKFMLQVYAQEGMRPLGSFTLYYMQFCSSFYNEHALHLQWEKNQVCVYICTYVIFLVEEKDKILDILNKNSY